MHKILVLRGGALGDFIVTLPALARLRERWPEARIELAGNAVAAQLALARGLIDAVHSQHEARWAGLFGDVTLSGEFADWVGGFDLIINFWPDVNGELSRHFPRHAGQRFLSASAMPMQTPAAAHYCEPLRAIGIETQEYFHRLSPLAHARSYEQSGCIAIHPGSGSPKKNWPVENWRRLIADLRGPVSLILGEAERNTFDVGPALAAAPQVANEAGAHVSSMGLRRADKRQPYMSSSTGRESHRVHAIDHTPEARRADKRQPYILKNRPLEELVDHLAAARLFLGHDSGISHLAAACGVKCVLLFGPTEPAMWAPPAPNVRVLRSEPLASFPVEAVRGAVEEALADQT